MGAGGSTQEIRAQSGPYRARRTPDLPKNKLPHEVLDGFTTYMKSEIEKSQDKQKRNRQPTLKPATKPSNPPTQPMPEVQTRVEPKIEAAVPAVSKPIKQEKPEIVEEQNKPKAELKIELENIREIKESEERKVESNVVEFKVETEEKEVDLYKNPESPRPAPPVFDENLEAEAIYNKQERKAKEKEAMEHAQRVALEQKMKVEQELGEKKNELNRLEDKYENIAAKYMNK